MRKWAARLGAAYLGLICIHTGCMAIAEDTTFQDDVSRRDGATKKPRDGSAPRDSAMSDARADAMPDAMVDAMPDAAPVSVLPQRMFAPATSYPAGNVNLGGRTTFCGLRTIGYGFTGPGTGLGTRKSALRCFGSARPGQILLSTDESTGTCSGDSGGPIMINNTNKIIGVLSGTNGNDCEAGTISFYNALEASRPFIDAAINVLLTPP